MVEHFAYPLPYNSELYSMELIPYRTNKSLKDKIDYLFKHPTFEHSNLYVDVSTSGDRKLLNDMSCIATACVRYYLQYPQQFGNSLDNIHMQILVRMWKQTFRHCKMQYRQLDKYYATKMKLLLIENGLIEELIRTVKEKDYIQRYDDMVTSLESRGINPSKTKYMYDTKWNKCEPNIRARKSLGTQEGSDNFEYLCSLD